MNVDRSLFLVLTAALAGGCHVYVDDPPPQVAANQSTPPGAPPPPGVQPQAPPPPPPRTVAVNLHTHPAAGGGGGVTPPPPSPAPATCLDANAATVPDCATMKAPDATCAPFPFPQQKCATYKTYFDPKVAASAISCMAALSSKQVCDATFAYGCGKTALTQACPDPALGQLCAIAATSCKSTPADCTALLSGLNDQGKQQVAQCVAQGCQAGLYSCVEGLK
jgi:hypothetical protein